jgi:NAD(P)H-dependent FMN reductase
MPATTPTLLIVHHSPSPNLRALLDAVTAGASHPDLEGAVGVRCVEALEATIDDVLAADAYVIGTSANIGYISGAVKHFFDTTFNRASVETVGRPFSYYIHGRSDTSGAEHAMESITTGLGWRKVTEPVCFLGDLAPSHLADLTNLGATVAASLL